MAAAPRPAPRAAGPPWTPGAAWGAAGRKGGRVMIHGRCVNSRSEDMPQHPHKQQGMSSHYNHAHFDAARGLLRRVAPCAAGSSSSSGCRGCRTQQLLSLLLASQCNLLQQFQQGSWLGAQPRKPARASSSRASRTPRPKYLAHCTRDSVLQGQAGQQVNEGCEAAEQGDKGAGSVCRGQCGGRMKRGLPGR